MQIACQISTHIISNLRFLALALRKWLHTHIHANANPH